MKQFDKLISAQPDADAVKQYIECSQQIEKLEAQSQCLRTLLASNVSLAAYVWRTRDGKVLPISEMDDAHLQNAQRLAARAGRVNEKLNEELFRRGLGVMPTAENDDDEPDAYWESYSRPGDPYNYGSSTD